MGFLHQDAMVYRLLMNKKFLDIFFGLERYLFSFKREPLVNRL